MMFTPIPAQNGGQMAGTTPPPQGSFYVQQQGGGGGFGGFGRGNRGRDNNYNHVLPPLLGAAQARLGARSSRRRQWVESEPCGRSSAEP